MTFASAVLYDDVDESLTLTQQEGLEHDHRRTLKYSKANVT